MLADKALRLAGTAKPTSPNLGLRVAFSLLTFSKGPFGAQISSPANRACTPGVLKGSLFKKALHVAGALSFRSSNLILPYLLRIANVFIVFGIVLRNIPGFSPSTASTNPGLHGTTQPSAAGHPQN